MPILFINAPVQIYSRAVPLIENKKFKKYSVVIPEELVPFFKENTNADIIVPNVHPNLITAQTKWKLFYNVLKARKEYKRLFKNINNDEIYLFFTSWSVVFLSYVKKLSKKNKVFLVLSEKNPHKFSFQKQKGVIPFFMILVAKIFLGVDVYILNKAGRFAWELNREKINFEIIMPSPLDTQPAKTGKYQHLLKGKTVLFLGDDLVSEGAIEESVVNITNTLMDILDERFKDKYVIKPHPREHTLYGRMAHSDHVISPYILAETLMNHDWKYIIGYYTEALFAAKRTTKATVISLLHLWTWTNPVLKEYWQKEFEQNNIIMPRTVEELKEILKG
ncbi:MAG: hypothetical protein QXL17_03700 [Candidatus Thermoplasmatota archaeon]